LPVACAVPSGALASFSASPPLPANALRALFGGGHWRSRWLRCRRSLPHRFVAGGGVDHPRPSASVRDGASGGNRPRAYGPPNSHPNVSRDRHANVSRSRHASPGAAFAAQLEGRRPGRLCIRRRIARYRGQRCQHPDRLWRGRPRRRLHRLHRAGLPGGRGGVDLHLCPLGHILPRPQPGGLHPAPQHAGRHHPHLLRCVGRRPPVCDRGAR
jgi:hypothetical protein